ncbi:nitroreductase [Athelia psychrophila]|uniref:Nitroreductase n=1 Tax=Athelia psychrophila TaxID=1759441 RepID=A0A166IMJ9_9AGAM|nr:nitroreductase [Fibularhizoctonia sp. CBS 109695]
MSASFLQAVKGRRTYYALSNVCPIPDAQLKAIIDAAVTNVPSVFNIQAARVVLLTGKAKDKLWDIVKAGYLPTLGDNEDAIKAGTEKMKSNAAGYGAVMFFEDQAAIEGIAAKMPALSAHFPVWSDKSTGMLQFVIWTALEAEGLGASLQHHASYSPDIASGIHSEFDLPETWKCTALMPFGVPAGPPGMAGREKTFLPIDERVRVFDGIE